MEGDIRDRLPSDYVMRELAKLANEQALTMLSQQARAFATDPLMKTVRGDEALLAFADAILSTNAKVWPKGKPS